MIGARVTPPVNDAGKPKKLATCAPAGGDGDDVGPAARAGGRDHLGKAVAGQVAGRDVDAAGERRGEREEAAERAGDLDRRQERLHDERSDVRPAAGPGPDHDLGPAVAG